MKREIRYQIKDLDKKIKDLTSKINQILSLGGIVPDKFNQELNTLNTKKKELETTPLSDLELRFKNEYEKVTKQINKHLHKVYEELEKAKMLSEESGIPFHSEVREMSDSFVPKSYYGIWQGIEDEVVLDGFYPPSFHADNNNTGWQQSQIC